MTRITGLLMLFIGLLTIVVPNVDRHGLGLRHFSEALAAEAKEIIAIRVRKQGFSCDKAISAERDLSRSKPNEAVWVLKCENASYRVRLIPRHAAKVDRM